MREPAIHVIHFADPETRKGVCQNCGPVSLYKERTGWRCVEKQRAYQKRLRAAPSRLPAPTTHVPGSHYHRMSEVDPQTRIGRCSRCGPGTKAKPERNGRWRCYPAFAEARNRLSRERRERAKNEKVEALKLAIVTLRRTERGLSPGPVKRNLAVLISEMRASLERAQQVR